MSCKEEAPIMKSALSLRRYDKPALLAVNKSTLMVWTAISLLLVETFSGALRYYFDMAGVSAVLYVPKILCAVFFLLELLTLKTHRLLWLLLLGLVLSSAWCMLQGAVLQNPLFSLIVYVPLLFAIVCGEHLEQRRKELSWAIGFCLAATILGVYLDSLFSVPWKGYSYNIGDQQLSANVSWGADGVDRAAGFARMSTSAAMLTALFTLYLCAFMRSRLLILVLAGVAFSTILITTNKSTALAFLVTLAVMPLFRYRLPSRLVLSAMVLMGLVLPMLSLWAELDPNLASSGNEGALSSLYDRMINTWPSLGEEVIRRGWAWTGGGFGMVGSAIGMFPVDNVKYPSVADSVAMYLWASFGIVGAALYAMLVPMLITLRDKNSWMSRAMLGVTLCIVVVGWTTDVLEVPVCDLFLGLAISHALRRKPVPAHWLIMERRRTDRDNYPDGLQLT